MKKPNTTYKIPDWVLKLPPGEYTLNDLNKKIKEVSKITIFMKMTALNVDRIKKKPSKNEKSVFYYIWKGAKYYYSKISEEQIKLFYH
jgi:hypothetical protein